jgi:hypothetical protein
VERQTQVCQNRTIAYGYDALYRLTSETVANAARRAIGNADTAAGFGQPAYQFAAHLAAAKQRVSFGLQFHFVGI